MFTSEFIDYNPQSNVEFKEWKKIPRENPFMVTITEKIDGISVCVVIENSKIVGVQSRTSFITPDNDLHGFAAWVNDNAEDLLNLGDGYHYGEWAGPGIRKNPHRLDKKRFFLFNTFRWLNDKHKNPDCCDITPILFVGAIKPDMVDNLLNELKDNAKGDVRPEGIVVYYHAGRNFTKHTIKNPKGKWCND